MKQVLLYFGSNRIEIPFLSFLCGVQWDLYARVWGFIILWRTKRVKKYEFFTITQLITRSLFSMVCKGLLRFFVLKLKFEPLYQTGLMATCGRVKLCQNQVISTDSFNLTFLILLHFLFLLCCVVPSFYSTLLAHNSNGVWFPAVCGTFLRGHPVFPLPTLK